jgi:hypothetical protein
MEVAAGCNQQAELARQDRQGTYLIGWLHAVHHFDGMATGLEKVGDQFTPFAAREVIV